MKNDDLAIPYLVRQLLQNKWIQKIVFDLYQAKTSKDPVETFLYVANERFNKIAEDLEHEGIEYFFKKVWGNVEDSTFLNHLVELGAVKDIKYFIREDDEFSVTVEINNPRYIKHLYEWVTENDKILNYGVFSLYTLTGEAYCLDNMNILPNDSGIFRVFKSFITEPTHTLSYEQIYELMMDGSITKPETLAVQQMIYKIKKKLGMVDELTDLFLLFDDKYYLRSL